MSKIPKLNITEQDKITTTIEEIYNDHESDVNVAIYQKKKYQFPDFVMVFQAMSLVITKALKPSSCKLLWYFIAKLQYSNHVGVDVLSIMEDLKYSKMTVITGLNQLKEFNIIIPYKDTSDRRRKIYIINPHHSWKGTWKSLLKTKKVLGDKYQLKLPLFPDNQ